MPPDTSGTTTFAQDSRAVMSKTISQQEKSQLYPVRDQSISDFLAKPFRAKSGDWSTANTINTSLSSFLIGDTLITGTPVFNTVWFNKLKGFNFIRATAVIRLQLNATPFHAGKLIMFLNPCDTAATGSTFTANSWRRSLSDHSQKPHVLVDVKDSVAIMRVPYVTPVDYFTLHTLDNIDWGTINLTVMSPLAIGASGETTIGYDVFVHFEDVELAAPMHPQSGAFYPQSGERAAPMSVPEREAAIAAGTGKLSKALLAGSEIAGAVAAVPNMAPFAVPASWVMRGLSHVASWFGWSKPGIDRPVEYVALINEPQFGNATGVSSAPTLGLLHDNCVSVRPGFGGVPQDEMCFDYLKTIKNYVTFYDWLTTDLASSLLATIDVGPRMPHTYNYTGVETKAYSSYNPIGYLSHYFCQYRGSVEVTFKIAKTDFHSGRLLFAFVPSTVVGTPGIGETDYLLREIVDIRTTSEITLKIPYLHYQKYITCDQPLGKLYVYVLNPLRAPETCAGSVRLLMFAGGGQDFELQVPGQVTDQTSLLKPFLPQSGVTPDVDQTIINETIGNYPNMAQTVEASFTSVGECFTSVKQLLLKYSCVRTPALIANTAPNMLGIYPFAINLPSDSFQAPAMTYDMLSTIAPGYLFMRGSINLGVEQIANARTLVIYNSPNYSNQTVLNAAITKLAPTYNVDTSTVQTRTSSLPVQVYNSSLGVFTARFPYYAQTHSTIIMTRDDDDTPSDVWDSNSYALFVAPSTNSYTIYRSVGEDFHLGYFLGFPPMTNTFP